jgi:predicted O-methyltransferase YrrM
MKEFIQKINMIEQLGKETIIKIPKITNKKVDNPNVEVKSWQVPRSTALFLHFLVATLKPKIVLEVGMSLGFSTAWIASACKEHGGKVYAVEHFTPKVEIARENFKNLNLMDTIEIIVDDALPVLASWPRDKPVDFLFLDANRNQYHEYFPHLLEILSDDGVLVVDNAGNLKRHMKTFFDQFKELDFGTPCFLDLDNGLFLFTKNKRKNFMKDLDLWSSN